MDRPDLSSVNPAVIAYIEYLEQKLVSHKKPQNLVTNLENPDNPQIAFHEPPTGINILTFSRQGIVKRTPRHLYVRQHRGGMGVIDFEVSGEDSPEFLACAREEQTLLLLSNLARVFRYPMNKLDEFPVRGGGQPLDRVPLIDGETIIAALPEQAAGYVALASKTGYVRCLRHHIFGEHVRPGTSLFNPGEFGELRAACWTSGNSDLLLGTKKGIGIRFNEKSLPPMGARGITLAPEDELIAVTAVDQDARVAVFTAEGKGSIRLMAGFAANKSPGGSGKILIRSDQTVGAVNIDYAEDVFLLTKSGKIIRFASLEIPATEGVVQGVHCIALRNDHVVSVIIGSAGSNE